MKYTVIIKEVLFKMIDVDADSSDEAIDNVRSLYAASEIVLDSSDFNAVDISIMPPS